MRFNTIISDKITQNTRVEEQSTTMSANLERKIGSFELME